MFDRRLVVLGSAFAAALVLAGCGAMPGMTSRTVNLSARLSGAAEVPPVTTPGSGTMTGTYDPESRTLTWNVTYSGLTGPATAAHFHGPASPRETAAVVVPFPNAASPIQGSAKLTDQHAADLLAGKWYVNVHTRAHPPGEIRGQVTRN